MGNSLGQFLHVEVDRALIARHCPVDVGPYVRFQSVIVEQSLGVNADGVVDNEFQPGESDTGIG